MTGDLGPGAGDFGLQRRGRWKWRLRRRRLRGAGRDAAVLDDFRHLAHGPADRRLLLELAELVLEVVELGVADRLVELGLEIGGEPPRLADQPADLAQGLRQVLGRNENQGHDADQQQLAHIEIEHVGPFNA